MTSLMEVICGWCQKHLGWIEGEGISHGICAKIRSHLLE